MIEWLSLTPERRREIINQVNIRTGISVKAIEKDWWVTLALKAVFNTPWAEHIVFKGGTSLSKAWGLIERFSEDIDLAIDRSVLGFGEITSGTQVKKLRRDSAKFIVDEFTPALNQSLLDLGADPNMFTLSVRPTDQPDIDPQILELHYRPDFDRVEYLPDRVLIEIGARSLREPCSPREIVSLITKEYPNASFAEAPFMVETVDPRRTFLEKVFLLHEMFQQPEDKWKHDRLSRHLYDIHRTIGTAHEAEALADGDLYHGIIEHRRLITPVRGVDYGNHIPSRISFIPPDHVLQHWREDYASMRLNMIYGTPPEFDQMIQDLTDLQQRIRGLNF